MKFFYTRSAEYLSPKINGERGNLRLAHFKDGEIDLKITENVVGQQVWIIANTPSPAENFLQTYLLLNTLERMKARINILITYLGYARQTNPSIGQPASAQMLLSFFKSYPIEQFKVIHAHSSVLRDWYPFDNVIPYDFFYACARSVDGIIAPDSGAASLATAIADCLHLPCIVFDKQRHSSVSVTHATQQVDMPGKRWLIVDDMICSGSTAISAARLLRRAGAAWVGVAATHGVFVPGALSQLETEGIDRIYVTNSLYQKYEHPLLEVCDMSSLLNTICQ